MVKILMGLVAVVVIAVGGFFGFQFYTQHRIAGEVEAAFEQIRAAGGKASHGEVSFDLRSHTLRIADIATESASQPPVHMKIASIVALGVGQPDAQDRRYCRRIGDAAPREHQDCQPDGFRRRPTRRGEILG